MEKLGLSLGYLLGQVFNFAIIFVVLRAWVYKPVLNLLAKRREAIAKGLEDARIAADARANAEKEAEKIIAEATAKANQTVRDASERADSASRDILALAEEEATKARDAGIADAEVERDRILADVRGQVAALAIAATQKLVGEGLDEQRQHVLIDQFFSGIKDGTVVVVEDRKFAGETAEITSALPLTEAEQSVIKNDLLAQIDEHAVVTFRVDPGILGGLVIRIGDKVVDGSVSGQIEMMRQSLS